MPTDNTRAEAIEAAARATATYWQDEVAAPDECDREAGKAAVDAAVPHLLAPVRDYVSIVKHIHDAYRLLVMDTPEDQELHDRLVHQADQSLALVAHLLDAIEAGGRDGA